MKCLIDFIKMFSVFHNTEYFSLLSKNFLCSDMTVTSLSSYLVYENFIGFYQDVFNIHNNTGNLIFVLGGFTSMYEFKVGVHLC